MSTSRCEDELAEFVGDVRKRLVVAAYRLCLDWSESEDLVQIALERYLRHVAAHEPPRDRLGYVMAIMRNAYYTEHRRSRWNRELPIGDAAHQWGTRTEPDMAPAVVDRVALRTALAVLPEHQRGALVLRYVHDQSLDQVAAGLGCTPGTAASRINRGLARLRFAQSL